MNLLACASRKLILSNKFAKSHRLGQLERLFEFDGNVV